MICWVFLWQSVVMILKPDEPNFILTLTVYDMSVRGAFWLIHTRFDSRGILIVYVYFEFSNFAQTKSNQYAQYKQPNIT